MEQWANESFDVIVVGSGPGGATVAKELSIREKRVLILEWGSAAPIEGSMRQIMAMALVPGKSLLFTNQMLGLVRGITAGGSSVAAYATAYDPPLDMFKSYGVDIGQEIQEAKSELPIAPLADELVGPLATRVLGSAQELGYDWQKLPKLVYQDKCRPDCDKCAFGCPYGAKWTARMYLEEARKNGAILPIMIKAKDSLGGRLTDGGGVRKRLDETDREKLMRGYARAKRILENERHSVSSVPLG